MSATEEMVAFTVRLAEREHRTLSELAAAEHRSLGAEARKAILAHIAAQAEPEMAARS